MAPCESNFLICDSWAHYLRWQVGDMPNREFMFHRLLNLLCYQRPPDIPIEKTFRVVVLRMFEVGHMVDDVKLDFTTTNLRSF